MVNLVCLDLLDSGENLDKEERRERLETLDNGESVERQDRRVNLDLPDPLDQLDSAVNLDRTEHPVRGENREHQVATDRLGLLDHQVSLDNCAMRRQTRFISSTKY